MEIFVLYDFFYTFGGLVGGFGLSMINLHFLAMIIGFAVWLGLFLLQAFGIRKMAVKRGMGQRWKAFVPFVNYLYMGKIAGDCSVFGQKVKKVGVFAMIAQVLATVFCVALLMAVSYLFLVEGEPKPIEGIPYWDGDGFSATVERFYRIGAGYTFGISILSILQLIYEISLFILTMGLYRRYAPRAATGLALLGLLMPYARFVIVFVLSNRPEIDWEEYTRARREAFARQQQQRQQRYGGNPYGGHYGGNPYGGNPYGNPYGDGSPYDHPNEPQQPQEPEEPFGEFGGKGDADSGKSGDDEFFN